MKKLTIFVLIYLLFPIGAYAQPTQEICGKPARIEDETLKGELKGKAKLLSGFLGKAELGGAVEMTKRDVFQKYPDANEARTNAYLFYLACILIMDDKEMNTMQKLRAIQEFKNEIVIEKPGQDVGPVRIELDSIQIIEKDEALARLKFININEDRKKVAVAFAHKGPVGAGSCIGLLRDYCTAKAILTDNKNNRYRYKKLTGLGMARDKTDWSFIAYDGSLVATIVFSKEGDHDMGSSFTVSGEIIVFRGDKSGKRIGPNTKGFSLTNNAQ